jgi:dTDP-4-dehydrorhamnose 3,5-epimerase
MMHTITKSKILGLQIIRPYIFKDFRGEYTETYNASEILPGKTYIQDSAILSTRGVLRGYHGDARTTKIVTCLHGAFQIVVLCIDPLDEEHFMKWETFILDDKERLSLVVPPRYVNAHQCLTDTCLFFYKQDTFYKGEKYQYSVKWDSVGAYWPLPPVLSFRDSQTAKYMWEYWDGKSNPKHLLAPEEVNK